MREGRKESREGREKRLYCTGSKNGKPEVI